MSVDKARSHYQGKGEAGKMNCGQAVIAAFKEKFRLDEDGVKLFASYGSGRAPGGECGALYAARYILKGDHYDRFRECEKNFAAAAGSTKCKEIRQLKRLPCMGCVETIAEFIDGI